MYSTWVQRFILFAPPSESQDGRGRRRVGRTGEKNLAEDQDHSGGDEVRGISRVSRSIAGVPQEEVLAQLRSDDVSVAERALDVIYQAFFTPLWRVAYRTTRSQDVAEELVQDVFFGVWEQRQTLVIRDAVSLYLHVAIRNKAYKYLRHAKVVERYAHADEGVTPGSEGAGSAHSRDPATLLAESEADRAFLAALASLPARDQDILILRWREGWSFDDIGRAMGMSSVAARVVVSRQQRRLRPFLERLRDELREP